MDVWCLDEFGWNWTRWSVFYVSRYTVVYKVFRLMVYHNCIEISEWVDNVVLPLSTQCLRFLSRSFMISGQTGHSFVHVSRIAPREVLALIPLPVFKKVRKSHRKV